MIDFPSEDDRLSLLNQIDEICDRYEAAWKVGKQPTIAEYLAEHEEDFQVELLPYLLEIEVEYRRKDSNTVSLASQDTEVQFQRTPRREGQQPLDPPGTAKPTGLAPEPFAEVKLPCLFDRFELMAVVGRGATSTVYRALDPRHEHVVALKICHNFHDGDRMARMRFLREAASAAKLQSRRIARVFEFGTVQDRPFLVMEYVADGHLSAAVQDRPTAFDFRTIANVISQVAEGLKVAHAQGVIHRDIKPSNILLEENDSPAKGPPCEASIEVKLVDFGLARLEEPITQMTQTGEVLGTPGYMSPEVIAEGAHDADARSDIYSLGVVFYQLLTGQLPFNKPMPALLQQILLEWPISPRRVDAYIPRELELLCLKCLEKNPDHRIQSASELQSELDRWLAGKAIATRPDSLLVTLGKRIRRNKTRSLVGAVIVASVILIAASFGLLRFEQSRSRQAVATQLVKTLLDAEGPKLQKAVTEVEKNSESLQVIEGRLASGGLTTNQEIRFRLVSDQVEADDVKNVVRLLLTNADPYEFPLLMKKIERETAASVVAEFSPEAIQDPIEFEFRRALLQAYLDRDPSLAARLAKPLAAGLVHFRSPERMFPWLHLAIAHQQGISEMLVENLRSEMPDENRLAATYALVEFHRDELPALVDLVDQVDAKQHQVICDALLRFPDEAGVVILKKLVAKRPSLSKNGVNIISVGKASEELALRDSRLLTALFRTQPDALEKGLRTYALTDPRLATYFMLTTAERGVPSSLLVNRLVVERDVPALRVLLIALGNYSATELQLDPRLDPWLKSNYLEHPSAAIHAAIRWKLRGLGQSDWVYQQDAALRGKSLPGKEWYVSPVGIAMVMLPAEGTSQPLAMSMEEITVEQYQRFQPAFRPPSDDLAHRPDNHPVSNVSAIEALRFCEWLNQSESQSGAEHAIEFEDEKGQVTIDTTRAGYRLPTMFEMQRASQAGAATARYFGGELTPHIERFVCGSELKSADRVGQRIPNGYGLFDTLGNVEEWTLDLQKNAINKNYAQQDSVHLVRKKAAGFQSTFGGAHCNAFSLCISMPGGIMHPTEVQPYIGFRIVYRPFR